MASANIFCFISLSVSFPSRGKVTLQVDDRRKTLTSPILLKVIFYRIVPIQSVMLLTGIQTFLCLYPATISANVLLRSDILAQTAIASLLFQYFSQDTYSPTTSAQRIKRYANSSETLSPFHVCFSK